MEDKMRTLKEQIIDTVKEVFGIAPNIPEEPVLSHQYFLKDKDGNYSKWVGVYSNSFRDDDLVPEILESGGHEEFVKQVDAGIYDYPELWIWHNPKWKIGKATFVAVDVVQPGVVFAIAGGDVDPEHYGVAKAIAESDVEWRMSHTFISHSRNDEIDSYRKWVTLEVSVLPAGKEANPLTSFGLLSQSSSEETMIDAKKREEIKSVLGINDAELDALESHNASKAVAALDNREFKEKSEEAPEAEAMEPVAEDNVEAEAKEAAEETPELKEETVETVEEAPVEAVVDTVEETAVVEEEEAAQFVDDGNMFAQFADLLKSMDARMDALEEALGESEAKAKALEEKLIAERAEREVKAASPLASMEGYQSLFAKYAGRANAEVGGAVVDEEKDEELLKSKPEEAKPVNRVGSKFNSSFLTKYVQAGS